VIVVELAGEPRGKGRPRFARRTGHAYTPVQTASYEACLRHEAALAMRNQAPLEGALRVQVSAYFGVPQSWAAKKRAAALAGTVRPTKRPDIDNVCKMLDGLNGIVFADDARIVSAVIEKHYSDRPRLRVEVARLNDPALTAKDATTQDAGIVDVSDANPSPTITWSRGPATAQGSVG
jgi:Holliday junction resolvase RusA-like endonuclease